VEDKGFILIVGKYRCGGAMNSVNVAIMNVYGPCSNNDKFILWREIEHIKSNENCAVWCVLGDFNYIRCEFERK